MKGNMKAAEGWETKRLDEIGTIFSGSTPSTSNRSLWAGDIVWVTPNDLSKLKTPYLHDSGKMITEKGLNSCSAQLLPAGSLVMSSRAPIGYVALPAVQFCTNQGCKTIKLKRGFHPEFTYYNVLFNIDKVKNLGEGTTFAEISKTALSTVKLDFPTSFHEQTKIAEILLTVDQAIEQTEALIAKQQRIKTGLMQDLLTRGIDKHGNLRSERTHKFKDSPLGRIPVEWGVDEFGHTVESAVDGPFGSNLKSDHYVAEPGVRVVRLANIGNGKFIDQDKAWISSAHGRYLSKHSVQPMDLLIASLGDERHPFGRACIYADCSHEAVVKADVFRVRCKRDKFDHSFAVHLFNFPRWRQGLFGLAQGVTRDRVNLTNMMLLQLPIPPIDEQKAIALNIDSIDAISAKMERQLSKIRSIKTALMQDLLTGKKRVTVLLKEESSGGIN
jgi:type I restriction enzyme, S subunit